LSRLALGVARHNGWAWFVTVASRGSDFEVVDRRRVEFIDDDQPKQPYHHEALRISPSDAKRLLDGVHDSVRRCTARALSETLGALGAHGEVDVLAVDGPPRRPVPDDLEEILASHQIVHTADGEMYRSILVAEAIAAGLGVFEAPRGKAFSIAADALGQTAMQVEALTGDLGKPLGTPWRKEHRTATAIAITALVLDER
jgi:hypothetical protein